MNNGFDYFEENIKIVEKALQSIDGQAMERLIRECEITLHEGNKIIVSGLGKNVPICDKFVGTMVSLGLDAAFVHTNSAVHGDMGIIHPGDLCIILSKSGTTSESIYLVEHLKKRIGVKLWLLCFNKNSRLAASMNNKLIICLDHEGDLWNILPNNSTTLNMIVLQTLAIQLSKRMGLTLEKNFKPNHPGGAIGVKLNYEQ